MLEFQSICNFEVVRTKIFLVLEIRFDGKIMFYRSICRPNGINLFPPSRPW